ncbi:MAG TPA: hypothetical protein VF753_00850 [Terriglobales bacterium]
MKARIVEFPAVVVLLAFAAQPSAVEKFKDLQQRQQTAERSGDRKEALRIAVEMQALLNNAPDAILNTAEAYANAGNKENALAALQQFADLGQSEDSILRGEDKTLSSFQKDPGFQSILKRLAENNTPISNGETAFVLSDPGLLAEDIDYDPASHSFLITSVLEKKIIRVTPDGHSTDFAHSPSNWPILAIKLDSGRNLVWATEVAMTDFVFTPKSEWGRSAVLCFDLRSGKLLHRVEGPPGASLGDMVLSANGDPVVTDGDDGRIYLVRGDPMERIDKGDFISPQTPTRHPDGKHIFVPDYARGIAIFDTTTGGVSWLNPSSPPKFALNGVDGLYFDRGYLIATQNGTSPQRVIRFRLSGDFGTVVSEELIERSTHSLDPTHGVTLGDNFYYIANSGWSQLDDHGNLKPGSKLTPARLMRFHL